ITSATFTTVFAFVPILMIQDASGEFLKSMPVTVIVTVLASLLVALTFSPYLASRFFKASAFEKKTAIQRWFDQLIAGPYRKILAWVLHWPKVSVLMAFVLFAGSLFLFPLIGLSFFPKAEKPIFLLNIELPVGSSIDETDRVVKMVENELQANYPEVKHFASNVGRDNPKIYYNIFPSERVEYSGQLLVELTSYDPEDFRETVERIDQQFANYPGAEIYVQEFEQGAPVFAPIAFRIIGRDIDVLRELGEEMKAIFESEPGTANVFNALKNNKTDLKVKVNKARAAALGVRIEAVNITLRTALGGVELSSFSDPRGNILDVTVGFEGREDFEVNDFEKLHVESVTGQLIPLQQIAALEFSSDPVLIRHYNFERSVAVSADAKRGYNVNEVTERLEQKVAQMQLPPGYRYIVSGQVASMGDAMNGIGQAAALAFICIFAILVLQFRSFGQPFIIFSAMPLAVIGSLIALYLSGYSASFTAFVGLTSLIGIVVNDSIILIDFANQARRDGQSKLDAIKAAGEIRFVPIILTSLTTIGGLLPLTLRGGTLWAPMGWTIIGGLMTSTFLILLIVPALYQIFSAEDARFLKRKATYEEDL
ncbi:MAG: efflux RND transporter permease subunit, partial [Bacteroidota bacterium]